MKTYELAYIISSQMTPEKADGVKQEVESFIQSNGGVIINSDRISAQPLAYPIKKQGSGFFTVASVQMEEANVKAITDKLAKDPNVIRYLMTVKKAVKEVKQRRTRKPSATIAGEEVSPYVKPQKETSQVEMKDIDKKIDEILGE